MSDKSSLKVVSMGINTHQEPVVYMHKESHICVAEGFSANARLLVRTATTELLATLNVVENHFLGKNQIGLSRIAMQRLHVVEGESVLVEHAPVVDSLRFLRKKIYGHALDQADLNAIMHDISDHRYRDIEIASFLSVCAGSRMNIDEIIGLTRAMVNCGKRLQWSDHEFIYDKHCIGGLPGNRTTPLVVAICSAAGLLIPKTSSRAITSPAGTADTMSTLFKVEFSLPEMQKVVRKAGACMVWGGAVSLSPADDLMVRIERELDIDGEGQLISSVLSKKIAAGSTHVIIDIPVGDTAKVRGPAEADYLAGLFTRVGAACGIHVRCIITDGSKPIGAGIGPVQEAIDLLAVLQCKPEAPRDLRVRGLELAANLFDMADGNGIDAARKKAESLLDSGKAWEQFLLIAEAQGGLKTLPVAQYTAEIKAESAGRIAAVDNRRLARLAKLAGAPMDVSAGLRLHANAGSLVRRHDPLFTLYSESPGERDYALAYYQGNLDMFRIVDDGAP
jgi:thymidine phosphorylase